MASERVRKQAAPVAERERCAHGAIAALPVTTLKGVGERVAAHLARLNIHTTADLCFHLPLRYEDRTRIAPIAALRHGREALIEGTISAATVQYRPRPALRTTLTDDSGTIGVRFFHFNAAQRARLKEGLRVRCYGEARRSGAVLEMAHPQLQILDEESVPLDACLTAVYPTTQGLGQATLRRLVSAALRTAELAEPAGGARADWLALLPPDWLGSQNWPDLIGALRYLHAPPPDAPRGQLEQFRHPAQRRLIVEELLAHHLSLRQLRALQRRRMAPSFAGGGNLRQALLANLPFTLTAAQQRVLAEIDADLGRPYPMQRLLQGDVGSGKTLVAALAMASAIDGGYQAALMAPTELLAEQHHANFRRWFEPLGVRAALYSGRATARQRGVDAAALAAGQVHIAVGTHALFQDDLRFQRLGLVVVDEQHRFGVDQRQALWDKGDAEGRHPHRLVMTATPIPRTLAMAYYGDLDVSVIDELPPGRQPVDTVLVSDGRRDEVIRRVRAACNEGRQAYWVCPLIEESDALQCQAAAETAARLRAELPELPVGLVHGRLRREERDAVMTAFRVGELKVLVATTVIEVGVDVPQASLMIIENAERLGLSQLHQLRGRVGRGSAKSACVLLYRQPLGDTAEQRLLAMRSSNDGFVIARRDLELRGPGELLGKRQSGALQLRIADLSRDAELFAWLVPIAERLTAAAPAVARDLVRRWLPASPHQLGP